MKRRSVFSMLSLLGFIFVGFIFVSCSDLLTEAGETQ